MSLPNQKPNHILEILGKLTTSYVRGSFDIKKNQNLVIEMILNNMKIEGQEVLRSDYIKFRNKVQERKLDDLDYKEF